MALEIPTFESLKGITSTHSDPNEVAYVFDREAFFIHDWYMSLQVVGDMVRWHGRLLVGGAVVTCVGGPLWEGYEQVWDCLC